MKTFYDLYQYLLISKFDINTFLSNNWKGKDKQESLFRLFCYLNIPSEFNNYIISIGNYDIQTIRKSKKSEIKKILSTSLKDKGDKSDLTFIHKNNSKNLLVTTSKNIHDYHIGDLDIEKIYNIYNEKYKPLGYKIKLCIVIPNKQYYYTIIERIEENNRYLYDRCKNALIIDHVDLQLWFEIFKKNFKNIDINDLFNIRNIKKSLNLYFHQKLSINKFTRLYNKETNILLGCIPRSGKSYIMAGIIDYYQNTGDIQNYLILTTCPNETIQQYLDIFENFIEFDKFNIYYLQKVTKPKNFDANAKNIIICSKQFLKYKNNNNIRDIKFLHNLDIKIRFIDEVHYGGTTELSDVVMEKYGKYSKTCFITATYTKPTIKFNILQKAHILWNLEDVQLCKAINNEDAYNRFINKHTSILHRDEIIQIINLYTKQNICKTYSIYPELHLLTLKLSDIVEEKIIDETQNSTYGWSPESIFLLKQNNEGVIEEFQNLDNIRKLCYNLFGKMGNYCPIKKYENCFLNRIEYIVKNPEFNSRWFDNEILTILCFLPCGRQPIDKLSHAFKNIIYKENLLPNFEIGIINSKQQKKPLEIIEDTYNIAKNKNKKGILILSGKQCSLGVSLHKCDIVLMLNNTTSSDEYLQMAFRSMTEAPGKKCGFVVDLNIQRVCTVLVDHAIKTHPSMSINTSIQKILRQRLINFNVDEWMDEYFTVTDNNISQLSKQLFNIYNYSPIGNVKNILNILNLKYTIFSKKDQKLINTLFSNINNNFKENKKKGKVDKQINVEIECILDEILNPTEISKGIEVIEKTKKIRNVDFINDVIKHIIPLISLLTIHDGDKTSFEEMICYIDELPELKDILISQLRAWWGGHISEKILNIFIILYNKYLRNIQDFNNLVCRIKEIFHINLNDKNKLSSIIDTYLLPHDIEIRNNAEIPTPYGLRQSMINLMIAYGDNNFWKSPKKVLEPTCGKGGFLLDIIDRFMDNLQIEDVDERYRMIVEECLYFADINMQNIYICKLLLDPYGNYKLNYYCGDSLEYEPNITFDLVIGNPPYNKINTSTGNSIWQKFVKKSLNLWLNENKYLIFVHPSNWRKPCNNRSQLKDLYKLMAVTNMVKYLEIHSAEDGMKNFRAGTRYDFYLIKTTKAKHRTIVVDEHGCIGKYKLYKLSWLPNYNIKKIIKILGDGVNILMNSKYHAIRDYVSSNNTEIFKFPLIHSTPKKGVRYKYSSRNDLGHFGLSKIIFGESGIGDVVIDMEGKYGMTQGAMAILTDDIVEAKRIKKCLLSKDFNEEIIKPCIFGNFRIEWSLFTYFKDDFWTSFI